MECIIVETEKSNILEENPTYKIGNRDLLGKKVMAFTKIDIDKEYPFYKQIPEVLRQIMLDYKRQYDSLEEGEQLVIKRDISYIATIKNKLCQKPKIMKDKEIIKILQGTDISTAKLILKNCLIAVDLISKVGSKEDYEKYLETTNCTG